MTTKHSIKGLILSLFVFVSMLAIIPPAEAAAEERIGLVVDDVLLNDAGYDDGGEAMIEAHTLANAIGGSAYVFNDDMKIQIVVGNKTCVFAANGSFAVSVYDIQADGSMNDGYDIVHPVQRNPVISNNGLAYIPADSLARALGIDSYCAYSKDNAIYYFSTCDCVKAWGNILNPSSVGSTGMVRVSGTLRVSGSDVYISDSAEGVALSNIPNVRGSREKFWNEQFGTENPDGLSVVVSGYFDGSSISIRRTIASIVEYNKIVELNPAGAQTNSQQPSSGEDLPPEEESIILTIGDPNMKVFGETKQIDEKDPNVVPIKKNDSYTLLPMRGVIEALGGKAAWQEVQQTAYFYYLDKTVCLTIGSNEAYADGKSVELDVVAETINDRTMVPVRFVSENLGLKVVWDEATQKVYITGQNGKPEIDAKAITPTAIPTVAPTAAPGNNKKEFATSNSSYKAKLSDDGSLITLVYNGSEYKSVIVWKAQNGDETIEIERGAAMDIGFLNLKMSVVGIAPSELLCEFKTESKPIKVGVKWRNGEFAGLTDWGK